MPDLSGQSRRRYIIRWIHANADHRLYAAQVNIIDFIEWGRSDSKEKVQTLRNVAELRAYTKQTGRQRYFATSSAKNLRIFYVAAIGISSAASRERGVH
jgi:hypothetical protein